MKKTTMKRLTAIVQKEGKMYVANCPEIGTISQGPTLKKALGNLKEATELYLGEFPSAIKAKPLLKTFLVAINAKA
jgi:predicted RNase H-like HicB family nuclease